LKANVAGLRLGLYLNWLDRTWWTIEDLGDSLLTSCRAALPAHTLVNASLGYAFGNAEVSVSAFDLFDRKFYEYPAGIGQHDYNSDPLRQKVTVRLTCSF
jgi:outer membrane receptor protein involved in Fe transport